ncbi:hypothetical protein K443DRAFT_125844 [Laccaria amethystina LaAM-08-1]|uniref:Uncharacterized protein n=1 Tax=Laccaria amethystina LaAM-08-1 TaxID=1095629 RepID=A0A0C9X4X1_9AGAR|nr:hypothetical protein K443DRAFT_125844 [Laccaria amethystina LaAM-08-1]
MNQVLVLPIHLELLFFYIIINKLSNVNFLGNYIIWVQYTLALQLLLELNTRLAMQNINALNGLVLWMYTGPLSFENWFLAVLDSTYIAEATMGCAITISLHKAISLLSSVGYYQGGGAFMMIFKQGQDHKS